MLSEVYAAVPSVSCKGMCSDQCTLIPIAPAERAAIERHTGYRVKALPMVNPIMMRPANDGLTCRYLKRGRCSIYDVRPMICRLYGAAEGLACPHGCRPLGGLLPRETVRDLLAKLNITPIGGK